MSLSLTSGLGQMALVSSSLLCYVLVPYLSDDHTVSTCLLLVTFATSAAHCWPPSPVPGTHKGHLMRFEMNAKKGLFWGNSGLGLPVFCCPPPLPLPLSLPPPLLPHPPPHYLEPRVLCMLGKRSIFELYPWVPTLLQ